MKRYENPLSELVKTTEPKAKVFKSDYHVVIGIFKVYGCSNQYQTHSLSYHRRRPYSRIMALELTKLIEISFVRAQIQTNLIHFKLGNTKFGHISVTSDYQSKHQKNSWIMAFRLPKIV